MLFGAVPALKENDSVSPAFPKHKGLYSQLANLRTKLVDLRNDSFSLLALHLAFPRVPCGGCFQEPRLRCLPFVRVSLAIRMKKDQRTVYRGDSTGVWLHTTRFQRS